MEKDIGLGSIGGVKLVLAGGKATVSIGVNESVLAGGIVAQANVSATLDASCLADLLFEAIEKASPLSVQPIEESVKLIIKEAIAAIQ